jgi:hypothetical protein
VTVAANGITNAKVADGALSPAKISGTAATVGSNLFTGTQVFNGAVGIGGAPLFNLHVVGPARTEARIQSAGFLGPAVLSLSTPSLTATHVFALEASGAQVNFMDRTVPNQPKSLFVIDSQGHFNLGPVAFALGQLTVADGGIGTAIHAVS